MFKLFHTSENKPKIIDKIFMHTTKKWAYCKKILTENPKTIFIGWFDETIAELENYFYKLTSKLLVLKARTTIKSQLEGLSSYFY